MFIESVRTNCVIFDVLIQSQLDFSISMNKVTFGSGERSYEMECESDNF